MTGPSFQRRLLQRYGPGTVGPLGAAVELTAGVLSFLIVAVVGLAFVHRPRPNALDSWVNEQLSANYSSPWAHHLTALGSKPALVIGVMVVFGVGLPRNWLRAVASASGPPAAVVIVDKVVKPLIEHLGFDRNGTYPSGTVACVVALSLGAILVSPKLAKVAVAVLGAVATVAVCTAVVVLRWHYPTDALGGLAVGTGAVLSVDGGLHLVWSLLQRSAQSVAIRDGGPGEEGVQDLDSWQASPGHLAEVSDAGSAS